MNPNKRSIVISAFVVLLMITNYTRLKGPDCIRPIHIVTLILMGVGIGVLITNLIVLMRNKNN